MADLDLERLRRDVDAGLPPPEAANLAAQRRAVLSAGAAPPARWPWTARLAVPAAVMAALVVMLLALRPGPVSEESLDFFVGDATSPATLDADLDAPAPLPVTFVGGTRLELGPDSRARVEQATRKEVRLRLSSGSVDASVRRGDATRWVVAAGPHRVVVTGTRFAVRWPGDQVLEVSVREGSVRVETDGRPEPIVLGAGDTLRADAVRAVWEVFRPGSALDAGPPAVAPQEAPATVDAGLEIVRAPSRPLKWRAAAASGASAEQLLDAVRADGVSVALAQMGAAEVLQVADAARFAGDAPTAVQALEVLLSKHPASTQARRAAFLRGRVEADLRRDLRAAATWFARSVQDAPDGPLAEESLGRQLECLAQLDQPEEARVVAQRYLRQYPDGAHAGSARDVVGSPR
jgi:TolA-binding protein